jgi:hypothetical protein
MATQAPVTADSKPPQHKEVEHFSEAERAAWLKDGTLPPLEPPAADKKVSSSEADASAASKPASEDGGKEPGSGPGKKARSQDENWRALEAERNTEREKREAAEKELEEYRTGKKKPEEKKADANAPKLLELPKRPKMADFMANGALDSDKYEAALDKYEEDKTAYTNQQVQIRTAAQQQEQSVKTWETELKAKYGDKSAGVKVKETVDKLAGTMQTAPGFFLFLNDSKVFTDLLYVLGGAEFKLDELLAEAREPKTAMSAVRKLRDIERDIEIELAKQAKEPPVKKENLTKAGVPPKEAAGGGSTPEDDGSPDAAWKRKDLTQEARGELYRERMNKVERDRRRKKLN